MTQAQKLRSKTFARSFKGTLSPQCRSSKWWVTEPTQVVQSREVNARVALGGRTTGRKSRTCANAMTEAQRQDGTVQGSSL